MAYNYSTVLPFERNFDPVVSTKWMQDNWAHSFTLSLLYVALIYAGQRAMRHRPAYNLRGLLIGWNLALALFSILGCVRFVPDFMHVLWNHGFQFSICVTTYAQGVTGFWTEMFALSKALELGDTVFIVLRKRPLIFLHYYHHVTVLVYTWHAYKDHTAAGRWFIMMNYFVHSLMYTYYAVRAAGVRTPKQLSLVITSLQLAQMVMGVVVAVQTYRTKLAGQYCRQTYENLYFSFLIYFTYFLLFAHFFYTAYLSKSHRKYQQYSGAAKATKVDKMGDVVYENGDYKNGDMLAKGDFDSAAHQNGYHLPSSSARQRKIN